MLVGFAARCCVSLALALEFLPIAQAEPTGAGPATPQVTIDAVGQAYEAGRCADVLAAIGQLPAGASVDGVTHYRWGYCLAESGQAGGEEHYRQAATQLASESSVAGAPLNSHFYRVNALLNLAEPDEAKRAASEAVSAFRAGKLTIPQDDAVGWFRLGKLMRDSGDDKAALDPYGRAVEIAQKKPGALRLAYLERIAGAAYALKDVALAQRVATLLEASATDAPHDQLVRARVLVGTGQWTSAAPILEKLRRGTGDDAMEAQYALGVVARVEELKGWGYEPVMLTEDGKPLSSLDQEQLRAQMNAVTAEAMKGLMGPSREVPRKNGKGTRPAPTEETAAKLHEIQSRWCGLMIEGVRRAAPLQVWAIDGGGFQIMIHNPWETLFGMALQQAGTRILVDAQ